MYRERWQFWLAATVALSVAACGDDDAPVRDGGTGPVDLGGEADLGANNDLGTEEDLGPEDLGQPDLGAPSCDGPPGLYVEGSCSELAPGVRAYAPQFRLWTDGAEKERFVFLPGTTDIDTSNPSAWVFPTGTKLWKSFSLGGVRLETRLLEKMGTGIGASSWRMRTFAWNAGQDTVTEVTDGRLDVLGTGHDIPTPAQCIRCHTGAATDAPLSFSAIQLNHSGTPLSLQTLLDEGRLSVPVTTAAATIPGDATARAALGYMHANCGNCHGGPAPQAGMTLWVDVGLASVEDTGTWLTSVDGVSGWMASLTPDVTARIEPGVSNTSSVIRRMSLRGSPTVPGDYANQMPPLGTEIIDTTGVEAVRAWIDSLTPTP